MIKEDPTQEEVNSWNNGSNCPKCSSCNITEDGKLRLRISGRKFQPMICLDCGKKWNNIWILTSFDM